MRDNIFKAVGRHANVLANILLVLILTNVIFQFYTHKTTALTPWKGGGFGMYTEPHVKLRSVWLELRGADETAYVRLYPQNEGLTTWQKGISTKGAAVLRDLSKQAKDLHYFPTDKNTNDLIKAVSRIGWLDDLTGGVQPAEGRAFAAADVSVLVYENAINVWEPATNRRLLFKSNTAGAMK